jgi:hypothetical protein
MAAFGGVRDAMAGVCGVRDAMAGDVSHAIHIILDAFCFDKNATAERRDCDGQGVA